MKLGCQRQDRRNPCHICGQTGHWANQCSQHNRNQGNSRPPQQPQRGNAPRGNLRG
jgi:Zinc knuckle